MVLHYVSYERIIEKEAIDFIDEQSDMLIEGIKDGADFDRNEIDALDRAWHENITDRAYSDTDAKFILEESRNVEDDRGLWDGTDPEESLRIQAAYTFSNDVWFKAQELYDDIKATVEDALDDVTFDGDPEEVVHEGGVRKRFFENDEEAVHLDGVFDEEGDFKGVLVTMGDDSFLAVDKDNWNLHKGVPAAARAVAHQILDAKGDPSEDDMKLAFVKVLANREIRDLVRESAPKPIQPGTEEERVALRDYMRMGRNSSRSGYPLGGAYIDARCGYGYGTDEFTYVWNDNQLGKQLPHLKGFYKPDVKAYYDKTFGGPATTTAEEMLERIAFLIRDGADSHELHELLPQIDAFKDNAPTPTM